MSEDLKSFEKSLDRDFLYYLSILDQVNQNITSDSEKVVCSVWLNSLLGKKNCTVAEKCDRNIFLSRLLLQMQNGKLKGIFQEAPATGTLPSAFATFGLPTEVDDLKGLEEKGFQVDSNVAGGSGDFLETSRDGRTYLATRRLPQGIMAYIAMTNNEGDDIWSPQSRPTEDLAPSQEAKEPEGKFVKMLASFVGTPMTELRKSPEERETLIEWMDHMIDDCNKWIQGEDPHNAELEKLFEVLYDDYKEDAQKCEILKHPKQVRAILIKDIRDRIADRRTEVSKRELILDQYEADEYIEKRVGGIELDDVWLQCAQKPMTEAVKISLETVYPNQIVQRFFELLIQERLDIIQKGELEINKKIRELRNGSLEEIRKELLKLKKAQRDYKELYGIYSEVEQKQSEYVKEWKDKCSKVSKPVTQQNLEKTKKDIEYEIEQAKLLFEKERRNQKDLKDKLEEAKEAYAKVIEAMNSENEKLTCEGNQLEAKNEDLENQISIQKRKNEELRSQLMRKRRGFSGGRPIK